MGYPESLRDPLPRSEGYPISRSALDRSLSAAGVDHIDTIYFLRAWINEWHDSAGGTVVEARFQAATRDWPRSRVELRIQAVPASARRQVRLVLESGIDAVADWVRTAETAENVWRSTDHRYVLRWNGEGLTGDDQDER